MNARMRTPLGRIEGLGSAKTGTTHFLHQRMTAVALVPLSIWFVLAALGLIGADRETAAAFLGRPVNAVLMFLFVAASLHHMAIGLQVIVEDYVHQEGAKLALIILNRFAAFAMAATASLALVKLALSGP
jgi:succinate dehydrogenase / fumarate reductase membrane anchor subunit